MSTNQSKAPRVFTRDDPCTKVDLHNAFFRQGQYRDTPVVDARAIIGVNAPKYLIREGYVEEKLRGGVDWYVLTIKGKAWLRTGVIRYLELHPERAVDCIEPPPGRNPGVARRVLRRGASQTRK